MQSIGRTFGARIFYGRCTMDTALKLYYSSAQGDNYTLSTPEGEQSARQAGYSFARVEGYGYPGSVSGVVPLKLYWHGGRGDYFTTATADGERSALEAGYQFVRVESYVFPNPRPGAVPLKLFWNTARQDNFVTATADGERSALEAGYQFARVEGYVSPRPTILNVQFYTDLGWGHQMRTDGMLVRGDESMPGRIDARTRIWTDNPVTGFHGVVQIIYADTYGVALGQITPARFWCDAFGARDQTVAWSESLDPEKSKHVEKLHLAHWRFPDWDKAGQKVNEAIDTFKKMTEIFALIKKSGGQAN
jgi:hypothetical protein